MLCLAHMWPAPTYLRSYVAAAACVGCPQAWQYTAWRYATAWKKARELLQVRTVPYLGAPGSYTGPYMLGSGSFHVGNKQSRYGAWLHFVLDRVLIYEQDSTLECHLPASHSCQAPAASGNTHPFLT